MPAPTLVLQTTYAELLERSAAAAFGEAFPEDGVFTSKSIKQRRYWYFQMPSGAGRTQKYVGPETPELLAQIASHKQARVDERERRTLVSTLVRFGLPRPIPEIGDIVAALARAGVFRLRGVLVGTVAYHTYSVILDVKLPNSILQTGDVDIAQYKNVSVAVEDRTRPVIDVLKEVDSTFRPVPRIKGRGTTSYVAKGGLRVDFLTPNEGRDTDKPQRLPAFQTDAQPLRFLDYLIRDPVPAVILHNEGIYLQVPTPERYAVHKLIISRRRHEGAVKRDKDVHQAAALLEALARKRPYELKAAWQEAYERGKSWRDLLTAGMTELKPRIRDLTLKIVEGRRDMLPGLDLTFSNLPAHYDVARDVVIFMGDSLGGAIQCAIGREALDDHFGAGGLTRDERVERFLENRTAIEQMARNKYLHGPIKEPETVLINTMDVPGLRANLQHRPVRGKIANRKKRRN